MAQPERASHLTAPRSVPGAVPGRARRGNAPPGPARICQLTLPGRPEHVREARAFVAGALRHSAGLRDVAELLTSELVTNAVTHGSAGRPGAAVTLVLTASPAGLRFEVTDTGSPDSQPVVRDERFAADGHGLFLVQSLADRWGHHRGPAGTTVWFWLAWPACP